MEMTPNTIRAERSLHLSFALLTLVTGLVDAASYLSMGHVFTANMTGNVVLLGLAVANVPGLSISRSLAALAFAMVGGVISGRLARWTVNQPRSRWFGIAAAIEAVLLFAGCLLLLIQPDLGALPVAYTYMVIAITALAMGIRNGTVRRLGVPDITTTVLTLTMAGLAADSSFAGGTNPRWGRRVAAVITMFLGALIGAYLLNKSLGLVLGFASLISLVAAVIQCLQGDTAQERAAASSA